MSKKSSYHLLYMYETDSGNFYLGESVKGYHPIFADEENGWEDLGTYSKIQAAAYFLSGGSVFSTVADLDYGELEIPDDLNDWQKLVKPKIVSISMFR